MNDHKEAEMAQLQDAFAQSRPLCRSGARTVVLYDVDSRIPNLALMKLSTFYKERGCRVVLAREIACQAGDRHFASVVYQTGSSRKKIEDLRQIYGQDIEIGGSGVDLTKRLPPEVDGCFPDYSLYGHDRYALGFLTRGCTKRCAFCVVPVKEGRLAAEPGSFSAFVPAGQRNVMLLDDNLLAFPGADPLLEEMAARDYAVNFSQTLDIAYLTEAKLKLLLRIDSRNARFSRQRIYFSLNHSGQIKLFERRREMMRAFGEDCVSVVAMYGFDTSLSQDYQRWLMLRRMRLVPFFQEYWPIEGVTRRLPRPFFDMDLDEVIRLTFRSNGQNWEKYLRWLNRFYHETFGRYYLPLVKIIYRYNNRGRIRRYLERPQLLTSDMYRSYR